MVILFEYIFKVNAQGELYYDLKVSESIDMKLLHRFNLLFVDVGQCG